LYRPAVRHGDFSYEHTAVPGIRFRQYKPRTIWDIRKRKIALCVALSLSDHVLQTWIGCLWGFRFASGDEVPDHFSKVRSRWQQQNPAPCAGDDTTSLLIEKSLSPDAVFAWLRIGFMLRVIELRLHLHKPWCRLSDRHSRSTSGKCQRQTEHYYNHPHYPCPEGCHFVPIAIARPASWLQAQKAANARLTAKRRFRRKYFRRNRIFSAMGRLFA